MTSAGRYVCRKCGGRVAKSSGGGFRCLECGILDARAVRGQEEFAKLVWREAAAGRKSGAEKADGLSRLMRGRGGR